MAEPTARERLERAMHVSFKLPEQVAELLNAYRDEVIVDLCYGDARAVLARHRDQVLTEAAELALATPSGHSLCHKDVAAHLLATRSAPDAPPQAAARHHLTSDLD